MGWQSSRLYRFSFLAAVVVFGATTSVLPMSSAHAAKKRSSRAVKKMATKKSQCTPIDLRDRFSPPNNMADIGWSYASTYADLVGYRMGLSADESVSTVDIVIAHSLENAETGLHGRDEFFNLDEQRSLNNEKAGLKAIDALQTAPKNLLVSMSESYLKRGRLCLASDEPVSLSAEQNLWLRTKMNEAYVRFHLRSEREGAGRASGIHARTLIPTPKCAAEDRSENSKEVDRLSKITNDWAAASLRADFDRQCRLDRRVSALSPLRYYSVLPDTSKKDHRLTANELRSLAHRELARENPVAIGFSSCRYLADSNERPPGMCLQEGLIVGREWNERAQSCQVIVRTNWGEDCQRFSNTQGSCELGHLVVDDQTLFKETEDLAFF